MSVVVSREEWKRVWEKIGKDIPFSKKIADQNPGHKTYRERVALAQKIVFVMPESSNSIRLYFKDDTKELAQLMSTLECEDEKFTDPAYWEEQLNVQCSLQMLPIVTQVKKKAKGKRSSMQTKIKRISRCFGTCQNINHTCQPREIRCSGNKIPVCWCK